MDPIPIIRTEEVENCRRIEDVKFKIDHVRLLVIYQQFRFDEQELRAHFLSKSKKREADIRIMAETDSSGMRYTYVLVDFKKRFQSSSVETFDIGKNHPSVFVIKNLTAWNRILRHFSIEQGSLDLSSRPSLVATPNTTSEIVPATVRGPPSLKLSDMKGWQRTAISCIRSETRHKVRRISVIVIHPRCGRSELIHVLQSEYPTDIRVLNGVPTLEALNDLKKTSREVWNRDTLLINIGRILDLRECDNALQYLTSVSGSLAESIWVFADTIPPEATRELHQGGIWDTYIAYGAYWPSGMSGQLSHIIPPPVQIVYKKP